MLRWRHVTLGIILLFALLVRLYDLGKPASYYFDEVYHAVTAKAYAVNNPAGYEWWHDAPEPGTAYEWLHPPVAKLFMALGWKYLGQTAWAWRLPGVVFGVGVIWLVYWLGSILFSNKTIGLLAAVIASLDGLLLAQSRIGMNDIYVTWFMLASIGSYVRSRQQLAAQLSGGWGWLIVSGVLAGLAISTKWSGIFVVGMIGTWELVLWQSVGVKWLKRLPWLLITFGILPMLVYLASYGQFWLQGHTWSQFVELHQQIWWYQTHLEATHTYQSKAWEWPFMIRPVWYHVQYYQNQTVSNIYNLSNPLISWLGLVAVLSCLLLMSRKTIYQVSLDPLLVLIVAYSWSWMPWLFSPRIMFFYHYTPAIPWLCIALATVLYSKRNHPVGMPVLIGSLTLITVSFIWLSPLWLNIPLPEKWWPYLFWLPTWK